jgi:hypothetical protein
MDSRDDLDPFQRHQPAGQGGQPARRHDALPAGASYGPNVHGLGERYAGPHPHTSVPQPYHFQVFALDTRLAGAGPRSPFDKLMAAMKGHVLASGDLVGMFAKPAGEDYAKGVPTESGLVAARPAAIRRSRCTKAFLTPRRRSAHCAGARRRRRQAWDGVRKADKFGHPARSRRIRRRPAGHERGLPDAEHLDRRKVREPAASRAGLDLPGRLHRRQRIGPAVRRRGTGAQGRGRGHLQLPPGRAGFPGHARTERRIRARVGTAGLGQLRPARRHRRPEMGTAQYRGLSAAIPSASPSPANRRAPARSASWRCRRWPRACSSMPSPKAMHAIRAIRNCATCRCPTA